MGWVQTRYRPYRWGNRVAVGVLVGQVLGMAHSPLAFPVSVPAMVQTAMARVAVASGAVEREPRPGEVELSIGEAAGPVTSAPGGAGPAPDGRPSAATATTDGAAPATTEGSGPGTSGATATTGRTRVDTTIGGSPGTATTGGGGSTPSTGGTPTTTPIGTTSSAGPTTSSTRRPAPTSTTATTRPSPTSGPTSTTPGTAPTTVPSTTTTGDLGGANGPDPCRRTAASVGTWLVTVLAGDAELVRLRRDVVAAATAIPAESFTLAGPSTWRVEGSAGALCTASKLVEVVTVNPLP